MDDNLDLLIGAVLAQLRGLLMSEWREANTRNTFGGPGGRL
jgi:hypothetical protein